MRIATIIGTTFLVLASSSAAAEVGSEPRDAGAGFVATQVLAVLKATDTCVKSGLRAQGWGDELILGWTERNLPYLRASQAYTRVRFDELEAQVGAEGRKQAEMQVLGQIRDDADKAATTYVPTGGNEDRCARLGTLFTSRKLDFANSPLLQTELADLLANGTPLVEARDTGGTPLSLKVLE